MENPKHVSAILIDSDAFASKTEFKSHCNADNPHKITCATIGASQRTHTHSADDVKSGILPVARGGTGVDTYAKLIENMSKSGALGIPVFGTYTGDGTQGRTISLGFTPHAVILCDNYGNMHDDINGYIGGIAIGSHGCCSQRGSTSSAESYDNYYTTLMIVNDGFKVNYYSENKVYSNASGTWIILSNTAGQIINALQTVLKAFFRQIKLNGWRFLPKHLTEHILMVWGIKL